VDGPRLSSLRRLKDGESVRAGETPWFAYLETTEVGTWFNNAGYVDALNPAALEKFAEVTYDAYARVLGDHLGSTVPAIFTDEPQLSCLTIPEQGGAIDEVLLTWTGDFADTYRQRFGLEVLDDLPLVVWDQADGSVSSARWRYHDHRSERFASAYAGTLGPRARGHGLALTGHMMLEDSLEGQVAWNGESMRSYPHFDIPGIDLLCDDELPTTAKQTVSVARQLGRHAVLSELYGVSGWHFDFTGHKRQGDWQAALGITVRVHHLSWMTMEGEAKRDYPAAIDWHSPWWKQYRLVEDHFSRLNTALTRGQAVVRVAVIHPVESTWQHFGPRDGSGAALVPQEKLFQDLAKTLIENLLDFDYVSEALIPELQRPRTDARLGIGEMAYDAVILPACTTLRAATLAALKAFADRGGRLIVLGSRPRWVEGALNETAASWLDRFPPVKESDASSLVTALEPWREARAVRLDGSPACRLYSQLRADGDHRWLFVCDAERSGTGQGPVKLAVKGLWNVERLDTQDGSSAPVQAGQQDGWTEWEWMAYPAGHELVHLTPAPASMALPAGAPLPVPSTMLTARSETTLAGPFAYRLDEPNVLVLDRAEFRVRSRDPWEGPHGVLRLDNVVRARFDLAPVHGDIAQPWSQPPALVLGTVELRFTFETEVTVTDARLALEQRSTSSLVLDGLPLSNASTGFWVDECLETVALPVLQPGRHELILTQQVREDTTREWCYLLGTFGVRLDAGRNRAVLTALPKTLALGDLVPQGLPFYAGNIHLQTTFDVPLAADCRIDVGPYQGPLVTVTVDRHPSAPAAFPPYAADPGALEAGTHTLTVTLYGNRHNAFGPLHLVFAPGFKWLGPDCYRTTGALWSDAWQLRPFGLMQPVRVITSR